MSIVFTAQYDNIVCFSDKETAKYFNSDKRFIGYRRVFADQGGYDVQGRRLDEVWIHWAAAEQNEKYLEMISMVMSNLEGQPAEFRKNPRIF